MDFLAFNRFYHRAKKLLKVAFLLLFIVFLIFYVRLIVGAKPQNWEGNMTRAWTEEKRQLLAGEMPCVELPQWPSWESGKNFALFNSHEGELSLAANKVILRDVYGREEEGPTLELKSLEPVIYRLQLEGYVIISSDSFRFLIRDSSNQQLYRGLVGDVFPAGNFEIVSCVQKSGVVKGVQCRYPVVTVRDLVLDRELQLSPVDKTVTGDMRVVMRLLNDSGSKLYFFSRVGERQSIAGHIYQLLQIDRESSTVRFQRTDSDGTNPRIQIYGLEVVAPE